MIKVIIPNFIKEKNILTSKIIKDICVRSFDNESYDIEYEERSNGK